LADIIYVVVHLQVPSVFEPPTQIRATRLAYSTNKSMQCTSMWQICKWNNSIKSKLQKKSLDHLTVHYRKVLSGQFTAKIRIKHFLLLLLLIFDLMVMNRCYVDSQIFNLVS
jgi:hypothetical protein